MITLSLRVWVPSERKMVASRITRSSTTSRTWDSYHMSPSTSKIHKISQIPKSTRRFIKKRTRSSLEPMFSSKRGTSYTWRTSMGRIYLNTKHTRWMVTPGSMWEFLRPWWSPLQSSPSGPGQKTIWSGSRSIPSARGNSWTWTTGSWVTLSSYPSMM